jgi:sensor histidine kinase YesM
MSRARRKRNKRLEREAEQLRAQLTEARLEALRMQINPHFLFNTLHTVATMAGSNPEGVRTATARLSEMLRYALSTSDQQEVPLGEELDILESYLDIQKLRLEERLITDLDIEPGTRRALVPTLLLQPLAENAVKHGFKGSDQPGRLVVRVRKDGGTLVLTVADNGAGLSADSTPAEAASEAAHSEEEHGLQNIAERLDGLYGDDASLDFERSAEGGLAVVIRLPYHTRETERDLRVSAVPAE